MWSGVVGMGCSSLIRIKQSLHFEKIMKSSQIPRMSNNKPGFVLKVQIVREFQSAFKSINLDRSTYIWFSFVAKQIYWVAFSHTASNL